MNFPGEVPWYGPDDLFDYGAPAAQVPQDALSEFFSAIFGCVPARIGTRPAPPLVDRTAWARRAGLRERATHCGLNDRIEGRFAHLEPGA